MAPLFVSGHACEFLVARLEVKGGTLHLEITADYGGNPFITDEAEARKAVKGAIKLRTEDTLRALEDLAPMKLEKRSQWDVDAPTAFAPAPDGQPHQLVTGIWQWQADAKVDEVTLVLPEVTGHDVLLWTRDEKLADRQAKWMMLIGGESSPVIRLERPRVPAWKFLLPAAVVMGLLMAGWVKWKRSPS